MSFIPKVVHKHKMAIKYEIDLYDKKDPKKRWIVIDYCTVCEYRVARDVTYEEPVYV